MDLTSSKLYHEARKDIANEVHENLTTFSGKNEALKTFKYLEACKVNAPKTIGKKTFNVFKDAAYKGKNVFKRYDVRFNCTK